MKNARNVTLLGAQLSRRVDWNGRSHLVVPVVGLVEGVVHAMNAAQPEFVPRSAFSQNVSQWEGKPIYYDHPLDDRGRPVSGNTADLIAAKSIGTVRNPTLANAKLAMEAWLDEERLATHAPDLAARYDAGEPVNISVGVFTETLAKLGEHGGRKYAAQWGEIASDHLAILPVTRKGACSWDAGCGLRAAIDQSDDAEYLSGEQLHILWKEGESYHTGMKAVKTANGHHVGPGGHFSVQKGESGYHHVMYHPPGGPSVSLSRHDSKGEATHYAKEGAAGMRYNATIEEAPVDIENLDEILRDLRNIPQSTRDQMPKGDFAGPNESFPIHEPIDVSNAARAIGRAKGDPSAIKAKIISIAYRKGGAFVNALPDAWKRGGQKNASLFKRVVKFLSGVGEEEKGDLLEALLDAEGDQPCGCQHSAQEEMDMTKEQIAKFLETATPEQIKALAAVADPEAVKAVELKAAADKKEADEKAAAAALKAAGDKKNETVKALRAAGSELTDEALGKKSQDELDALLKALSAPKPPTFEDLLKAATPEVRAAIDAGVQAAKAKKDEAIKALVAVKDFPYDAKQLEAKSQEELDAYLKMAKIEPKAAVDFGGQGAPRDTAPTGTVAAPQNLGDRIRAARAKK